MSEVERDIFRDSPLRLLGYTNEVGESFRPLIHVKWVYLSYGIASAYVVADTTDKTYKVFKIPCDNVQQRRRNVMLAAVDTLLWQSFASVIIPGFTINRICAASLLILSKTTKLPKSTRKWITTAVGLSCIPFIVKPIDYFVDIAMDRTFRVWISKKS
ncbi:mitochondrial fission process protein 1 [Schistocerca gregaria]|uniref:mitochondrial fission process protein 1 n=1 Tax=Schistocerca gregaria TaxID=7010 RepID=UPI00211DDDEB|nr:mitochondrial fission process protein 1 [Schistocerca gregaria]